MAHADMDSALVAAFQWVVVDHPTPLLLGAFGLVTWYLKQRLQHGWAQELEKVRANLQGQLDADRADLQARQAAVLAQQQRELESYKVGLIAEAERAKAMQDVSKALALKIGEHRFTALASLHEAAAGLDTDACAFAAMPPTTPEEHFRKVGRRVLQRRIALIKAHDRAQPFVSREALSAVLALGRTASAVMKARGQAGDAALAGDHEAIEACTDAGLELDKLLREMLLAYEAMVPLPPAR